jgi:hypothetical protein
VEACHFSLQSDIAAWREIARTASMDAVSTKFGGGGAAAKLLAGAQRTEIFILGKMPRSLSAMLLNEIETDCVGCGPKLDRRPMDPALFVRIMIRSGIVFPSLCQSMRVSWPLSTADSRARAAMRSPARSVPINLSPCRTSTASTLRQRKESDSEILATGGDTGASASRATGPVVPASSRQEYFKFRRLQCLRQD